MMAVVAGAALGLPLFNYEHTTIPSDLCSYQHCYSAIHCL